MDTQNFCQVEISGPRQERMLVMRSIDKEGKERWSHSLRAADLVVPG